MDVLDLRERLKQVRRKLDRQVTEARLIATRGKELKIEVDGLSTQAEMLEQVAHLLASIGEQRQEDAQRQIEALVTKGLTTIFGEDISFHIIQDMRGRTPTVEFVVRSLSDDNKVVETGILDARGGGFVAVIGFLLRIVILMLSDKKDTILVLDETFAHVSEEFLPNVASFVRQLVDNTGIQIIMVTHSSEFTEVADKRFRFQLVKGVTKVEEI